MKHSFWITFFLVLLFLATQFVGLKIIDNYVDAEATAETGVISYKPLPYNIERPDVAPETSVWLIVIGVLIGTALILLLIRFRQVNLWRVWFFLSVLLTLSVAFSSFIASFAAFLLSLFLSAWKIFRPNVIIHNITEIFIYGGLAAIFVPLLNILAVSILLVLISAYDAFAVWKSRHMVKMAEFQTSSNLFSGLYIPHGGNVRMEPVSKNVKGTSRVRSAVLGGGDMGFPLIFAGVVMKDVGLLRALAIPVVVSFFLLGLLIFGKKNRFYPAMPFLTVGCFIGYLIAVYVL